MDQQPFSRGGKMAEQTKSLYIRLGGYDAITAVVEDLLPRLVNDAQLGRFWQNRGVDGLERVIQLLIVFLCASAGGPLYYTGRDMALSHKGMKISGSDWATFVRHLNATLDTFQVPQQERSEVLAFVESTRPDIVEV
jgi:hemoglobin